MCLARVAQTDRHAEGRGQKGVLAAAWLPLGFFSGQFDRGEGTDGGLGTSAGAGYAWSWQSDSALTADLSGCLGGSRFSVTHQQRVEIYS